MGLSPTLGPQPKFPVPGREVPLISGCENQWGVRQRATGAPAIPLKGPVHGNYLDSLLLNFSAKVAARKAPGIYEEELNWLAS